MILFEYCKEGDPVSDFEAEKWIETMIGFYPCDDDKNYIIKHCSECITYAIRALVKRGTIDRRFVAFKQGDLIIPIQNDGMLDVDAYIGDMMLSPMEKYLNELIERKEG